MVDDRGIGRGVREEVDEVIRRDDGVLAADLDLEAERDEAREEQVARERRRLPRRRGDLRAVQRVGEQAPRDTAREREGDRELRVVDVDPSHRRRVEEIGDDGGCELFHDPLAPRQ